MPPSSALLTRLALHFRLFLRPFATQDSPSSIQDVARSCGIPVQAKPRTMTPAVAVTISVRHFVPGQYVDIAGITIGKGFQGAMKRWGFSGMPAPHGASLSHRSLGSTGACQVLGKPWFSSQVRGVSILRAAHVNGERQGKYNDIIMKVKDLNNQDKGTTVLSGDVFDVPIRQDIVHRVVCWQLAKRRQGTHSTKTISEVSGTGKKPYQQKGTGRARHGTLRGPQFRHGATMHGPKPRNYEYKLPKKVRRLGLKIALSARVVEGKLVLVDNIVPATHKTKEIATYISGLTECKKVLFVDGADKVNTNLCRSTSNLHFADVLPAKGLNVYSILQHDTLVMTIDAVRQIEERMHTPISR